VPAEIPFPDPALEGSAFALRPFEADDFAAARALELDEAAARWVPSLPAEDGESVVRFYDACRRDGTLLHLVIADPRNGGYLGETMLALAEHGVGEVGCCVVPAARGQGLATHVLRTLTDWAFATLGLGRVQVFVAPENIAALRLAESAGFEREGVLRSYWEFGGKRLDAVILARIPDQVV
jgi:RimJ/RimL family protein N-acetyltransferase